MRHTLSVAVQNLAQQMGLPDSIRFLASTAKSRMTALATYEEGMWAAGGTPICRGKRTRIYHSQTGTVAPIHLSACSDCLVFSAKAGSFPAAVKLPHMRSRVASRDDQGYC